MRSLVDTSYELSGRLGDEGLERFEKAMSDFNSWASSGLAEKGDTEKNNKRKHVPMTQETYEGTANRVYNTKTMG